MTERNTAYGSYGLKVGKTIYQKLEVGEAHTVSPDDVLPVPSQLVGEYPLGGQPGMGE